MSTRPTDNPIPATSPHGIIINMNAFISPANVSKYISLTAPIMERFRKEPECRFCEITQNPADEGHVRLVHGWTEGSRWWNETHLGEPWFKEYIDKAKPMWIKDRVIEHFNCVDVEEYL